MDSLRDSPVFALVVLVTLVLVGLISLILIHPSLITGVLGHDTAGHVSGHFRFPHHRVHDITFGLIFGTAVSGLLAQLRKPSQNAAAQFMALIPWFALALAFLLARSPVRFAPAPVLGGLTLIAAFLHPARRDFFRSFDSSRVDRTMLALVIVAAVPLLLLASSNIVLQRELSNDHAALGHYGFMATFSFTVIGVGLLAGLRPIGWRLTAWLAGLLPVLLGLASLVYPDVDSSLGLVWSVAAIAWGVGFVATAELSARRSQALRK